MNMLYFGDCLTVMQQEMKLNQVDLIYLDPPFNSNRTYNAIYKDETGLPLPDQIEAFCDIWTLDSEREKAIRQIPDFMLESGIDPDIVKFWNVWVRSLRNTNSKLLAYLSYMVERLVQMKLVLKPTGSIYLHCDPTYSHYIKVIMDGVFGEDNYRAEIVWKRHNAHNDKLFGRIHDTIFYYSYGEKEIPSDVLVPLSDERIEDFNSCDEHGKYEKADLKAPGSSNGESGQPWHGVNPGHRHWSPPLTGDYADYIEENFIPNYRGIEGVHDRLEALDKAGLIVWSNRGYPRLKRYFRSDAGQPPQSIWDDILKVAGDEDEGYDTQKPVKLLERIIKASTKEGDVVFDPFCGCGTTIEAAHNLKRQWIGIDIAIHAIKRVCRRRLRDKCGLIEDCDYQITGVPRNVEGAEDLWKRDKFHFQKWAVEHINGFPSAKLSHDKGIDGQIYFAVSNDLNEDLKSMAIEVKGGANVNPADLRALGDVLHDDDFMLAGMIVRKPFGRVKRRNFADICRQHGEVEINGRPYPRLQILSIPEIFEGKVFEHPWERGKRKTPQLDIEFAGS